MSTADGYNADILDEQKEKLRQLFPEVFSEDRIDWDKLRATLGNEVDLGERYNLTWKGKSNVFRAVQEKTTKTLRPSPQESVDWETTQNLFIEGDNLEVLRTLRKAYYGKIKMIYIDPPYNTGNDFVYNDEFAQAKSKYEEEAGIRDENGDVTRVDGLRKNTKENGHFHSDWLNMIYPRLYLAKNLLRQDGVIFVSIDDNEVNNLRMVMNEIFGEENFIAQFIWKRRQNSDSRNQNRTSTDHEYIIAYSRNQNEAIFRGFDIDTDKYKNPDNDSRGPWASIDLSGLATRDQRPNLHYDLVDPSTGNSYAPNPKRGWSKSKAVVQKMIEEGRILFPKSVDGRPREKKFLKDLKSEVTGFSSWLDPPFVGYTTNGTREVSSIFGEKIFDFPKPVALLKMLAWQATGKNDIVLDFFGGSGTLAQAVNDLNAGDGGSRKWICVQLPEETEVVSEARKAGYANIAEIAKERIRRTALSIPERFEHQLAKRGDTPLDLGFKVYKLADSNLKVWSKKPEESEELKHQLLDSINPIADNTNDTDLLTELMLKNGIGPLTPIENHIDYNFIPSENLAITLSRAITQDLFIQLLSLKPQKIILLDIGFDGNSQLKTNLILQAEQANIDVEVI